MNSTQLAVAWPALDLPMHPRRRVKLAELPTQPCADITLLGIQSYIEFLNLWKSATLVLSDSVVLQGEATALSIPCLTLRYNTERPITVEEGSNTMVGTALAASCKQPNTPCATAASKGRASHSATERPRNASCSDWGVPLDK